MVSQFYPCISNTNRLCFSVEQTPKTFDEALKTCQEKGGTLSQAQNSTQVTAMWDALRLAAGVRPTDRFWIGAQASYAYEYPPCGTNGGRSRDGGIGADGGYSPECREFSATSYEWLRTADGGSSLAIQRSLDATLVAGVRTNSFARSAFGASRIPARAGVTFRHENSGTVDAEPVSTSLPFICSYDSATEVKSNSFAKTFNIEFNLGLNASVCVPSTRIGACLSLDFQVFQASWAFGSSQNETNVFRGMGANRYQQSLFGESENTGKWERKLFTGSLNFELRFIFFSDTFKIKEFQFSKDLLFDGDIYPTTTTPYFRRLRE